MFKTFYVALSTQSRKAFADAAGTTTGYIETHLIAPPQRRKVPNKPLMERLAAACAAHGSQFTREQLVAYFYEEASSSQEAGAFTPTARRACDGAKAA